MRAHSVLLVLLVTVVSLPAVAQEAPPVITLEQAVARALANHPTLRAAGATVEVMQARTQGERAIRFPQVKARFVYPFIGTESGVSLNQRIWDFQHTHHRIQSSRAQVQASELDQEVQRADVILHTKVAYYTVLMQQQLLLQAEKAKQAHTKRLEQAEGLFRVGRLDSSEVTKARIALDTTLLTVSTAHHDVAKAKIELAHAMGMPLDAPYELEPVLVGQPLQIPLEHALHDALVLRHEIQSVAAREEAMQSSVLAAKRDAYPMIFGRLEYRIEGEGADQPAFIVGVGIQGPIFDGFANAAKVKEAHADLRRTSAELTAQKQQVAFEVRQAHLRLTLAEEHIRVTERTKHSAEANFHVVEEHYRLGRVSGVELAEAESLLVSTTTKQMEALYNYHIAMAQLERAVGKDLDQ
jgi:outer membrane protein TolC